MEQYEQKSRKIRQKFYFLNYFCNIMRIQKTSINRTPPVSSGKDKNYSIRQLRAQPATGLVWSGVWTCMHTNVLTHAHMHTCLAMTAPLI